MKTFKEFISEVKIDQADFDKWKKESDKIQSEVDKADEKLAKFGRLNVSDEIRSKPEWKKANKDFKIAFKKSQDFAKGSDKNYLRKVAMDKRSSWKKS